MVQGIHFFLLVTPVRDARSDLGDGGPVQAFFGKTILLYLPLIFVCPLLTMRLFAEERRSGTIEALLTAPVGTAGVTLAKYAAALATYAIMWAPTRALRGDHRQGRRGRLARGGRELPRRALRSARATSPSAP